MRAPRRFACSYSSRITTPAPSDITKPSRSLSHGRLARVGSSLRVDRARAAQNVAIPSSHSAASEPPAIITSAWSYWMKRAASPMALEPVAHAVATVVFGPLMWNRIETLPLAALAIRRGTVNGLTRPTPRSISTLFCSSMVSMPPMPLPITTPQR
jgi:hypothetical protein